MNVDLLSVGNWVHPGEFASSGMSLEAIQVFSNVLEYCAVCGQWNYC